LLSRCFGRVGGRDDSGILGVTVTAQNRATGTIV
jgi:hypothetical protein